MTKHRNYDANSVDTELTFGIDGNMIKSVSGGFETRNNADDAYSDLRVKNVQAVDAHFTGDMVVDGVQYVGEISATKAKTFKAAINTVPTTTTGDGGGLEVVTGGALAGGAAGGLPGASITVALTDAQAALAGFTDITDSIGGAKNIDLLSGNTGTEVAALIDAVADIGASWAGDTLTITSDAGNITVCTVKKYTGETLVYDKDNDSFNLSTFLNLASGKGIKLNDVDILSASTALTVPYGGTGKATLTDHAVLLGSGTGTVTEIVGLDNQFVAGNTGADASFKYVQHVRKSDGTAIITIDSNGKANVPADYETANLTDDTLMNKQYIDKQIAAGIGGVNREATVTADSVESIFSVGTALPSPSGKIRLSKTVIKVGTIFSGNSVAGLRITDGANILVPFGVIDITDTTYNQHGGMCLTDIKGDTLKVEFRTAADAGTAIPTAGALEIVVENTQT